MTIRGTLLAAWVTGLVCGLVACGGSTDKSPAAPLVIDVTIAHGQVTPTHSST